MRQRAKRGSIAERLVIPFDAVLIEHLRRGAKSLGVSVSEYVRRAVHERLLRDAARRLTERQSPP